VVAVLCLSTALSTAFLLLAALFQDVHGREGVTLDEFQEGTAAGGDVGDVLLDAVFLDGGHGFAATGDGEALVAGDGARHGFGALGELGEFKDTDGAVPEDGLLGDDDALQFGDGLWADVEDHFSLGDILHRLGDGFGAFRKLGGDHYVLGQRNVAAGHDGLGL